MRTTIVVDETLLELDGTDPSTLAVITSIAGGGVSSGTVSTSGWAR